MLGTFINFGWDLMPDEQKLELINSNIAKMLGDECNAKNLEISDVMGLITATNHQINGKEVPLGRFTMWNKVDGNYKYICDLDFEDKIRKIIYKISGRLVSGFAKTNNTGLENIKIKVGLREIQLSEQQISKARKNGLIPDDVNDSELVTVMPVYRLMVNNLDIREIKINELTPFL